MKLEVSNLKELVDYQEGSIVSKTLINKDKGTVTIFAFDKYQSLSEHKAPFDALVNILDGEAIIKISGEDYHLKEGNIIILPANKPHAVNAIKKFKMMLIMIKS
jgi:quercetin dioxygenase-like cupin family protein